MNADPTSFFFNLLGHIGPRRLRLIACAFCRSFGCQPHKLKAVEKSLRLAEDCADYKITIREMANGCHAAFVPVRYALVNESSQAAYWTHWYTDFFRESKKVDHVQIIKEIVYHPFLVPTLDKKCLLWNNGTVLKLSQNIYETRDYSAMPILGDALEDAGCENQEILDHLRGEEPHYRGCWVIDTLLGKS